MPSFCCQTTNRRRDIRHPDQSIQYTTSSLLFNLRLPGSILAARANASATKNRSNRNIVCGAPRPYHSTVAAAMIIRDFRWGSILVKLVDQSAHPCPPVPCRLSVTRGDFWMDFSGWWLAARQELASQSYEMTSSALRNPCAPVTRAYFLQGNCIVFFWAPTQYLLFSHQGTRLWFSRLPRRFSVGLEPS